VLAAMAGLRRQIAALWAQVADAYTNPRQPVRFWRGDDGIGVVVDDRVPVRRLRLQLDVPAAVTGAAVRFCRGGGTHTVDVTAAVAARGAEVDVAVPLVARHVLQIDSMRTFEVKFNRAVVRPASYELVLAGLDAARVVDVRCERGEGRFESAVEVPAQPIDLGALFAVVEPRPLVPPRSWRGQVDLAGVTTIDAPLVIEPGTVVRLAADASVVLRGRVLARGTESAPIRFEPAGEKPWGVVALQGQAASGSVLRHCEFVGGSGYKTPLFEYSAMLSVHDVREVLLDHCRLRDSKVVDDMLHTVYAELQVSDCQFLGAPFDAVDLDISQGVFERCLFERTGNDGLDLMTATALVVDCTFRSCGDKGISVGEDSRLLALRPKMLGCGFGVQAKDDSVATVVGGQLAGNECAVDAYKKNWRYGGGGRVFVYNSELAANKKAASADGDSAILLRDCRLDPPPPPTPRVTVDGGPSAGPPRREPAEVHAVREAEALRRDR
jgi:hypothetical protein